jgi:hypothetical protein
MQGTGSNGMRTIPRASGANKKRKLAFQSRRYSIDAKAPSLVPIDIAWWLPKTLAEPITLVGRTSSTEVAAEHAIRTGLGESTCTISWEKWPW